MLNDDIIEQGAIFLRNLNVNGNNTEKDKWASGTGYGYYSVTYENQLEKGHYYYQRYTYKFTTTNLSPTWQNMYTLSGMVGGAGISNPVADTEYTISGIFGPPNLGTSYTLNYGTMYNGDSNHISGVTSYVKNVLVYDVTELYMILKSLGTVSSTSTLKTWCDNNLEYVPRYTNYDISSKITNSSKVLINKGTIICDNFVETDGMVIYSINSNVKAYTYFDGLHSALGIYNNNGNGTVSHSYVSATSVNSPFKENHSYCLKITTNGSASPGAGGFYPSHSSYANAVFIERFVAKIPIGYSALIAYNSLGSGADVRFITPNAGTGDWAEYAVLYKCGSSGSFSSGGHIYVSGTDNTSVTWYLAYFNMCDITGHEELANYTVLPNKHSIKATTVFDRKFDGCNLISNGDGAKQETAMLPSGWSWDTTDVAGNAYASIVLPVGAASGYFGPRFAINPQCRYKISMWIKGKNDMTSYLMFIPYSLDNGTVIGHTSTNYYSNTKTTLAAALNVGDTTVTLTSAANWAKRSYANLGFRSNSYSTSYNDLGQWNKNGSTGCVASVSGNVVTLDRAYDGTALPKGRCVVEAFDGAGYKYPLGKSDWPSDNTWKYIEVYFGLTDALWDGNNAYGNWYAIPTDCTYARLGLNLYSNTSSVPLKFCDIRVEEVSPKLYGRSENKILLETKS